MGWKDEQHSQQGDGDCEGGVDFYSIIAAVVKKFMFFLINHMVDNINQMFYNIKRNFFEEVLYDYFRTDTSIVRKGRN